MAIATRPQRGALAICIPSPYIPIHASEDVISSRVEKSKASLNNSGCEGTASRRLRAEGLRPLGFAWGDSGLVFSFFATVVATNTSGSELGL